MSEHGPDDPGSQRWRDADSVLHRQPTHAAKRRRRRSRNLRIILMVAIPLLGVGLGALLVATGRRLPTSPTIFAGLPDRLGWALEIAGILCIITGIVWMVRAGQFKVAWRSPLVNLSRADRKQLIRTIRHGDAAPDGQQELASYLATRMKGQHSYLLLLVGLFLSDIGQSITQDDAVVAWVLPLMLALLVVGAVLTVRDKRHANRWLDLHDPAKKQTPSG